MIDVGTGPGLPGIPLAMANPELEITLLDSNHKKTTFLRQACLELGLSNVTVECARVETWTPEEKFRCGDFARLFRFGRIRASERAHLCAIGR